MGEADERQKKARVSIPKPLKAFFVDVDRKIQAGDKSTLVESDDLIQAHVDHGGPCTIYGGLVKEAGLYGFTYFPDDDEDATWELRFTRQEIQQIATGKKGYLDLWKCLSPNCKTLHANPIHCSRCDGPPPDLEARLEELIAKHTPKPKPQ